METQKVIHGLPQVGNIPNDKLKQHMAKFGYDTAPITTNLWRHQTRPIQYSLVVDDFGIQYESQDDINHLLDTLKKSKKYLRNGKASYTLDLVLF